MSFTKFIIITLISTLASLQAWSQETCIQLEGLSIGCVPSQSHVCFRNVNVALSGGNGSCKYTKLEMTGQHYKAPKGAIAFECASPPVIETTCVKEGDSVKCTTTSTCKEYSRPVCQEICELCHKDVVEEPKKVAGCIVCTRPRCQQEPTPSAYCPAKHPTKADYYLPDTQRPVCGSAPTCSPKATDPNGVTHDVTIIKANCPPNELVKEGPGGLKPPDCPWISDPGPNLNGDDAGNNAKINMECDKVFPIKPPNRYPEDYNP